MIFDPIQYKAYYTLNDILDDAGLLTNAVRFGEGINTALIESMFNVLVQVIPTEAKSDEAHTMFAKYLVPSRGNSVAYTVYENCEDKDEKRTDWLVQFTSILNATSMKYQKLIEILEDNKDKLMNGLKTTTRFNDTPQNGGEFFDDDHTSNFTETEAQYVSRIQQIREIQGKLTDYYSKWAAEFDTLFIESAERR